MPLLPSTDDNDDGKDEQKDDDNDEESIEFNNDEPVYMDKTVKEFYRLKNKILNFQPYLQEIHK